VADEVELVGFLEVFADVDEVADDLRLSGGVGCGLGERIDGPNDASDCRGGGNRNAESASPHRSTTLVMVFPDP
jgi:hypothetical protein